ncbi:LacI family transcriptional regulator [Microbacterium sp. W1N]|uniref:LacI family DNA-binding transcriptional regulator n=1 Tax=Microbacterium festucae TaxID=2977531 RepID=UPI0021C190CD|nr:LacI family DNA-binding transcriptional regulator [Microbacterium festucae]MCT9821290.1 LacI family transcriptional regulator [Microbacterium festucae]
MTTIADVAHAAGVSISTVSYVMSGKRTISQETRLRVEQAIAELSYSPHASARSLASRATNVIGLQAPLRSGVDVNVVMQIVAGIVREARAFQYDILLLTSDDAAGLERAARASAVDALLVMDIESHDPRLSSLGALATPSVLIGLPDGAGAVPCVDFDFESAGRLAAHRLAELGHTRIALLGAPAEVLERHTSYAERLTRGFLAGCAERGITGTVHATPSSGASVDVVQQVAADAEVTAFFVHNEAALPHVMGRLARIGRERGTHADVIALAPADLAQSVSGLTDAIDIPAEELGRAAARVVQELLAGGETPRVQLLPPRLASASDSPLGVPA